MPLLIRFLTPDGEEREEEWPSLDAFRSWAIGEGRRLAWTAYQADEDGDWVVVGKGTV